MDQMASSVGGFIAIDFKDTSSPIIESVPADFEKFGHALCIVDAKGDHADLTAEYAAIPQEMKAVAGYFTCDTLRQLSKDDIMLNIPRTARAVRRQGGAPFYTLLRRERAR